MYTTRSLLAALAVGLSLTLTACGGGGSSNGGSGSTSSGSTGGSTTATSNSVNDLRVVGAPLVSGDVPVAFRLINSAANPATVVISFSIDSGQSWTVTTEGANSSGTVNLATGPNLGIEHIYVWDSASDVPSFEPDVRIKVDAGWGNAESAPFAIDNQALSSTVQLDRHPWLQTMTQTSVNVLWRTTGATDTVIEFGDSPALGLTSGDPNASTDDHVVTLSGLLPATRYTYRVLSGGQPVTPRKSFVTAPDSTVSDFTFLAWGDSGTASPEQFALGAQMAREDADLLVVLGDIVYPDGGQGNIVPAYNARFFAPYRDLIDELCVYPSPGNHDRHDFFRPYRDTFITPTNGLPLVGELYYSFEWGDAKFVMLETTTLFRFPIGPHMVWLQNQLSSNTRKWLIVYMHHVLYSAGGHGDDTLLINILGPIFENNGVDLVISGHEHSYERTNPIAQFNRDPAYRGLTYLISGGGGTSLRAITPNANTAVAASAHHYLRIKVQGDTLIGDAIGLNGQLIDSFALFNQ